MKKDILNNADIVLLIDTFYDKVKADPTIGYIFNDIVKVNWEKHLPVMYKFWENILFFSGGYIGQPMILHQHLHHITPLTLEHFAQWNKLFDESVDELFEGKESENAKKKGKKYFDSNANKNLAET